jgi:hypothetical protein
MMFPKNKPARSPKYLMFVRQHPCCLTGKLQGIDAHHQNKDGHGGKGTKCCDSRAIPIHYEMHNRMESPGNSRKATFEKHNVDPEVVIEKLNAEWLEQGNKKFW